MEQPTAEKAGAQGAPTPEELYRLYTDGENGRKLTYAEIGRRYGQTGDWVSSKIYRYRMELLRTKEAGAVPQPLSNTGEKVEEVEAGNTREINSESARITTLDQLIDFCKIDLDTWTIERHVVNKWEVGTKDPATGQVLVEPLFQVKAWLVRKKPEAIRPVISPVTIDAHFRKPPEPRRGLKCALVIPDMQIGFSRDIYRGTLTPFHDRKAMDLVLQIARHVEPELVVFAGDVNDWSGWSDKFIHRPEFYATTQPALIEAAWYIAQVKQLAGRVVVIEGNHDLRPETQMVAHLVDAYGLKSADNLEAPAVMSVDNLLGLSRMGVEYVNGYPDAEVWINDSTRVVHGEKVRGAPGATAAAVVKDANENVVFAHVHRIEQATKTIPCRHGYRTVTAFCPGCLCHVDGRVPGSKRSDQWQQGACLVWYDDERASILPVDIYEGAAVYGGELYSGHDYVEALKRDTGWSF